MSDELPYSPATVASMKADLAAAGVDATAMTPRGVIRAWNTLVELRQATLERQFADARRPLETKG
jgi:hypothetical protein